MNQELIACLKELLARVESCPFDLGPMDRIGVKVCFYTANECSKAITEQLVGTQAVKYGQGGDGITAWHSGFIGKHVEIIAFTAQADAAEVIESQPLELGL